MVIGVTCISFLDCLCLSTLLYLLQHLNLFFLFVATANHIHIYSHLLLLLLSAQFLVLLFLDVRFDFAVRNQVHVFCQLNFDVLTLLALSFCHPSLEEPLLSLGLDFIDFLHGLDGFNHECSIVPHWFVSSLLEFKHWVYSHVLSMSCTVRLSPSQLPWVLLTLEQTIAL